MLLHLRFAKDFPSSVIDNFKMLYVIPKKKSKVTAKRFWRTFNDAGAPIKKVSAKDKLLFELQYIDNIFECYEAVFDHSILREHIYNRLKKSNVTLLLNHKADSFVEKQDSAITHLSKSHSIESKYIFNTTYSKINSLLEKSDIGLSSLKHELVELALFEPPKELKNIGLTVMDGPFFSFLPFPAENKHSLSHVKYSVHKSWLDDKTNERNPNNFCIGKNIKSNFIFMLKDSQRFIPIIQDSKYIKSMLEIKTVLQKNEQDDGRPILYQTNSKHEKIISILGGKIDNIYDLFELVRSTNNIFKKATLKYLIDCNESL